MSFSINLIYIGVFLMIYQWQESASVPWSIYIEDSKYTICHISVILRSFFVFFCLTENNNLRSVNEIDQAGNIYIGQIDNNGKKQGHGVFIWADLRMIFDGQWKDNKRVGLGELKWSDGHWYKGEWKDDERSGLGVMEWPNKQRYTGQFHI